MDTPTSLSICRAIGVRLRDNFQPTSPLPPRLQMLLAALDREDHEDRATGPNI